MVVKLSKYLNKMQAQQSLNSLNDKTFLYQQVVLLLSKLIETSSFSKEEELTATVLMNFFHQFQIHPQRYLNNVWVKNLFFDERKPTIILNSHHDTVKPNKGYTKDPFKAIVDDDKLYGLGSNDAGGSLVSLIATFLYYYKSDNLKYNLILVASAEEEISGVNGIETVLPMLGKVEFGIVGEPTLMNMAVAEKGLLVLDVTVHGKSGHAAREEGVNALYIALKNIEWIQAYKFDKVSPLLGSVKMSVTCIETDNKAHNVVPATCRFVIDVRVNELYTFEEVIDTLRKHINGDVEPRSLRMKSSSIASDHPLVLSGVNLGRTIYGSPTTSDKALMNFPTLKIGPGDSARSHTADEFIYLEEVKSGIDMYIELLKNVIQ